MNAPQETTTIRQDPPVTGGHMAHGEQQSNLPYHAMEGGTPTAPLPPVGSPDGVMLDKPHDTMQHRAMRQLFIWKKNTIIQACYIGLFAIFGTLIRIALAQWFGEECANPGTVGWLAAAAPLCVTANGHTQREGGIVFADLPANLLGSFIMGMLQSGYVFGMPVNLPLVWLPEHHAVQSWSFLHKALKTGFCGSLTTFSSWNSEMVVMLYGTGRYYSRQNNATQFWSAIFGYVIGMETALGSYLFGMTVAKWFFRLVNPNLAQEWDAMRIRLAQGVPSHGALPQFERRYLSKLDDGLGQVRYTVEHLGLLEKWRESTVEARRVGHVLLPTLHEIELAVLVNHSAPSAQAEQVARAHRWDLGALVQWAQLQQQQVVVHDGYYQDQFKFCRLPYASVVAFTAMAALLLGLIFVNGRQAYIVTYRTMIYAMLLAPAGALTRWWWSGFNEGGMEWLGLTSWSWLPAGTLLANVVGSVISIVAIAVEFRDSEWGRETYWKCLTGRAIKVGFAGSLTTVSSFVSEVRSLMSSHTDAKGYTYVLITLTISCILGMMAYGWILYV